MVVISSVILWCVIFLAITFWVLPKAGSFSVNVDWKTNVQLCTKVSLKQVCPDFCNTLLWADVILSFICRQVFGFKNYDCQNTPNCYEKPHIVYNIFVCKVGSKCYVNG